MMSNSRPRYSDSVSAEHLRKLEALFPGGNAPSAAGPTLSRTEVHANPRRQVPKRMSRYRVLLERLRMAREREEIEQAANAFLEHYQLPDDLDILYKVLNHPDEKILCDAMGQISSLLMQGRIESTVILNDRLEEMDGRIQEEATQSYIDGLRKQLESKKTWAAGC